MANTLMFEVGIKRANEEYNKILEEVKALAKMADNSISLKVQLEKSNDLKTFLDALKQLGDGKMLEPLLNKIDNLQASMVRLGMIPKDIDYSNLEKQLQKVTVAYENYQKARERAGLKEGQADVTGPTMALGQVYRTARANLEKEFGLSENVARATMDTFKNMGNTIQENMARIGGSKAGMESLSGEVGGLTTKVDALVNAFSSLVSQLKSLGTGSGVKDMATDVAKVDEGTTKMAQALAKAFGNLNEKKADVKVSEDSLATATNTAAAALKAEEAQAQATAASILRVADSISVATLATKNLYTILGGNREDIAKFLELANTMDMLSRKSAYIMNSGESFSGGKMGAFTEVKKEMEAVQAQMDELKKSGLSGSPIIDSFATAFKNLSEVLTAAGTSVKESTKNLKSLGEGAKNLEKISESQERANRAKNQTTESIQKETQARKKGAAAANETSSAEDKAASAAKANAEAIQKLLTATQELTTATNNLKMAIGSWGQDKGTIATMVSQFEELRKKITQVVEQWEKLAMVKATGVQNVQVPSFNIDLSSIEPTIKTLNEAVAQLKKSMDLLWESTNRMESSLKAIVTPETFKKVESDAASAKQKVDELSKSVEGMKMQSEKKGSETTLNANLDVLKNHTKNVYEALTQIAVEYEKLSNQKLRDDGLEQRLLKLREYYEWLQKVATMTDTLSKPGALKADATKFNGELLMGKQTKEMWSDKAVKDFQKIVEEILSGRRAAESFETAIQKLKERVEEFNSTGSKGFGGVGAAMETINRVGELNIQTLIKEQAHIERMMKLAEGSSKYMEGHKVAGMDKLQAVQDSNMNYLQTLNRWISLILQNRDNPDIIRFLNTPQSLKLPLPGRADDVAMFNAHYDKLKHSITDTSAAARQLVKDMSLTDANASVKQWNTTRLETGLYNVQDAIQGIMRAWRNASQYADEDMTKAVAQQINRLNAIKQEILTAMTNEQLLSTRHGYASVINPDNTHTLKDSKQMVTDLNAFTRERIKAEKEYNKEVERFTNQSKKEAARQEQEYQKNVERWQESQMKTYAKAEQEKAKAAVQAQKDIQKEIERTEAQMRKLDSAISRGTATPGRDMTILTDARSKLQGQLNLLKGMTPADMQNNVLVEKRIKNIRTLRDDTDALRKSEERLTTAQQQSNRRSDRADDKRLKDEIKSVNDAYVKYNELGAKLNELQALRARGITANVDVSGLDRYIEYLEKVRQLMKEIYSNNGRTSNTTTVQDFGIRQGMLASEALAHNNVKSSSFYNKNNLSQFTQDLANAERRMKAAGTTADNLQNRINALNAIRVEFLNRGLDTTKLSNAIDSIRQIQTELRNLANTGQSGWGRTGKDITNSMNLAQANRTANNAVRELNEALRQNEAAANQMSLSQQKLSAALNQTTESAKGQSQVISDLKMLATQYLGVWGAQDFLRNIIQIGGQLEMQRMSIGAILQNTAQANELFDKIKGLAVQSPFGVVELDQMTKQLTAYGFRYNELFDMTKRLADISAATGTGVDRLALALGHVRAEAALSGYTLRQFSMGNVPLLQKLSEKLGKTAAEIRKMVSKKEIGYDDVVGVLKDLTNEGGMFYNMQETISESVKAKFKNVKDAMDIMYGEMAEGDIGEILKGVAASLMEVTRNWRDAATIIGTGAGMWLTARLALVAYTSAIGSNNAAVIASISSYRQREATMLSQARMYRTLTAAEVTQMETSKRFTAMERLRMYTGIGLSAQQKQRIILSRQEMIMGQALALSSKKLTAEDIAKQVATTKLTATEARRIIILSDLTAAEKMAALQAVKNVRTYGALTGVLNGVAIAATRVWSAMTRMFLNPQMLIMAGVTAAVELWQRNSRELERASELSEKIYNHSQESLKNTRTMLENTGIKAMWRENPNSGDDFKEVTSNYGGQLGGQSYFELPKFDATEAKNAIETWAQYIREYAATPNRILNEALFDTEGNVLKLKEQFQNLRVAVTQVAEAQDILRGLGDVFENAINATNGGWFNDDVITNIQDYDKSLKSLNSNIASTYKKFRTNIDLGLIAARKQDQAFDAAVSGMATYAQQLNFLVKNQEKYSEAVSAFRNANPQSRAAMNELSGDHVVGANGMGNVNEQREEMMKDLDIFYTQLEAELNTKGIKIGEMTDAQQQALLLSYKDKLSSIQGLSEESANELMKLFAQHFGIELDVDDEKFRVKKSDVILQLEELIGRDWSIPLNFGTNINDVIKEARTQYKTATEYFKNVEPILVKFGVKWDKGKELTHEQIDAAVANADESQKEFIRKALMGVNEATKIFNNATDASKSGGFSLEDDKKKNKGNKGKQEDKEAKRLREIAKLYKDAYDWYNKYEKQVGEAGALKKVQAQFQPLFDEFNKTWKTNLTLDSIPTYKQNLTELLDEAMKLYKTPKHKNSYMVEAIKQLRDAISNVDYEEANRQMDIFASKVKIQLDNLTRAWSTFNNVRETTGNADFAAQIARVSYDGNLIQNSADAIRNQIQSYYNEAGGNGVLTFDMELSDEDILKKFQNAVPSNDEGIENYQKRIKGLVEAYKQWRDLQRTVRDDAITAYAKMVTDSMSLKDKIAKINNEYQKTITNLNTLRDQGIIGQPEYDKRKQQAENQRKVDNLSALANSATFEQSFGIVGNVLKNAARELDKKLREEISSEDFKKLTPSQQKSYIEASDKLHSASQTATSPFNLNAWGELMEASRTYKDNVNKLVASLLRLQQVTIALEQAEEDERNAKNESQRKDAQERRKKAEKEKRDAQQAVENDQTEVNLSGKNLKDKSDLAVKGLDNFSTILGQFTQGTLSSFVLAVGNVIKSIKGDGEMAQSVGQLFGDAGKNIGGLVGAILSIIDALGDDPTGFIDNLLNKIASVIENVLTNLPQIIGSVIKGAGNIVASVVDGVGGLFGLDFGLSDLFNPDKKLQEKIDDLKADVTKIEANTSVLRSLRERSLGYDSGQMRKDIANIYNKYNRDLIFGKIKFGEINIKYGAAGKAMSEFYSQNLNGNGYSQEYANLLKQRRDYIDMYNAENDKKDSSASAMAEYQSKIAELDEEIMFFTQDLANTLWGIDIKSWANQISDALWNAFENGENAVKAFEKTAKDIVASVAKEMMKLGFIEPLMQNLQKQLFGTWDDSLEMYVGGAIKYTKDKNGNVGIDMQGSEKAVLKVLGSFYGQSEEFAKAGETFYNWVERATGIRFSDNDSALSGNIKGITEDTADLLASYINAIRADVAMNRAFIAMFIQEYWISYIEQITSVHTTLRNIDRNVAAMALTFSETGKIYGLIENISSRLDKFANGVDKISVQ